jgi:hypothetical protein
VWVPMVPVRFLYLRWRSWNLLNLHTICTTQTSRFSLSTLLRESEVFHGENGVKEIEATCLWVNVVRRGYLTLNWVVEINDVSLIFEDYSGAQFVYP